MSCSESNGALVLICGLPASGKTQLTRDILLYTQNFTDIKETVLYTISFDDYLNAVTKNDEEWKTSRQKFQDALEHYIAYVLEISNSTIENEVLIYFEKILKHFPKHPIKKKYTFVLDDNFYYFSMRHEWYKIARKYKLGFGQIFLKCSISLALTQNASRPESDRIPEEVIRRMTNRAEWPDPINDKIHCHSLIVQSEDNIINNISLVMKLIYEAVNDPVLPLNDMKEEKEASKRELSKNLIHQSDIILRKIVADVMKKAVNSKNVAQKIPSIRLSILRKIKAKQLGDLEGLLNENSNLEALKEKLEVLFLEEISACKNDLD